MIAALHRFTSPLALTWIGCGAATMLLLGGAAALDSDPPLPAGTPLLQVVVLDHPPGEKPLCPAKPRKAATAKSAGC